MKRLLLAAAALAMLAMPCLAAPVSSLSCDEIVRSGWDKMPDVADYIQTLPGSDQLGFGSECHLGSLVFAQCFVEPRWSVKKAIDTLIWKATHGKRLPDTPVCGA
jgi:hypothetical protein